MIAYDIMLVMIMFSAVCGALNEVGWYYMKLPVSGSNTGMTQAQVTDLTKSSGSVTINAWTNLTQIMMAFRLIGGCLLALLTIIPFLTAFGVPLVWAVAIQTPIWFIVGWTVFEMWSGHPTKVQE
jgi:hypothetical protein